MINTNLLTDMILLSRTVSELSQYHRVPTGQGKLEKVREFEWSGKGRENAKNDWKVGNIGENFTFLYSCCNL